MKPFAWSYDCAKRSRAACDNAGGFADFPNLAVTLASIK